MTSVSWLVPAMLAFVPLASTSAASAPTPTDPDSVLARLEGVWHVMTGGAVAQPGSVVEATVTRTLTAGGRWLVTDTEGRAASGPCIVHGLVGYDAETRAYVGWQIETGDTRPRSLSGTWSRESQALVLSGESEGAHTRHVITFPAPYTYREDVFASDSTGAEVRITHAEAVRLDPPRRRVPEGARERTALVDRYLAAYEAMDLDAMTACYTEDAVFEDPTYVLESPSGILERGPVAIAAMLRSGWDGTRRIRIDVAQRFEVGPRVVLAGRMNTETTGAAFGRPEREVIHWSLPFVTILTLRDGRIAHHLDYFDYELAVRYLAGIPPAGKALR